MTSIQPSLYANSVPSKVGRLLLSTTARKVDEGDVTINIYEYYLVETSSKGKAFMALDFDLKYGFHSNPPSIYFEKESVKQKFELKSGSELSQWREILKDILNQRGFH